MGKGTIIGSTQNNNKKVITAGGDGNCFYNSSIIGLIDLAAKGDQKAIDALNKIAEHINIIPFVNVDKLIEEYKKNQTLDHNTYIKPYAKALKLMYGQDLMESSEPMDISSKQILFENWLREWSKNIRENINKNFELTVNQEDVKPWKDLTIDQKHQFLVNYNLKLSGAMNEKCESFFLEFFENGKFKHENCINDKKVKTINSLELDEGTKIKDDHNNYKFSVLLGIYQKKHPEKYCEKLEEIFNQYFKNKTEQYQKAVLETQKKNYNFYNPQPLIDQIYNPYNIDKKERFDYKSIVKNAIDKHAASTTYSSDLEDIFRPKKEAGYFDPTDNNTESEDFRFEKLFQIPLVIIGKKHINPLKNDKVYVQFNGRNHFDAVVKKSRAVEVVEGLKPSYAVVKRVEGLKPSYAVVKRVEDLKPSYAVVKRVEDLKPSCAVVKPNIIPNSPNFLQFLGAINELTQNERSVTTLAIVPQKPENKVEKSVCHKVNEENIKTVYCYLTEKTDTTRTTKPTLQEMVKNIKNQEKILILNDLINQLLDAKIILKQEILNDKENIDLRIKIAQEDLMKSKLNNSIMQYTF